MDKTHFTNIQHDCSDHDSEVNLITQSMARHLLGKDASGSINEEVVFISSPNAIQDCHQLSYQHSFHNSKYGTVCLFKTQCQFYLHEHCTSYTLRLYKRVKWTANNHDDRDHFKSIPIDLCDSTKAIFHLTIHENEEAVIEMNFIAHHPNPEDTFACVVHYHCVPKDKAVNDPNYKKEGPDLGDLDAKGEIDIKYLADGNGNSQDGRGSGGPGSGISGGQESGGQGSGGSSDSGFHSHSSQTSHSQASQSNSGSSSTSHSTTWVNSGSSYQRSSSQKSQGYNSGSSQHYGDFNSHFSSGPQSNPSDSNYHNHNSIYHGQESIYSHGSQTRSSSSSYYGQQDGASSQQSGSSSSASFGQQSGLFPGGNIQETSPNGQRNGNFGNSYHQLNNGQQSSSIRGQYNGNLGRELKICDLDLDHFFHDRELIV